MSEALLIVDFQNDFTPGGALEVPNGDEIAERVNELATSGGYEIVIATRDWHPREHSSFKTQGGTWPQHCVAGTGGAEIHAALDQCAVDFVVDKGQDTSHRRLLRVRGARAPGAAAASTSINAVTVVGLATDYCVKNTALDALKAGLEVRVDTAGDARRGRQARRLQARARRAARRRRRDHLTSKRSSNMTSPSSVRCTGHLAAIVMSFSR